MLTNQNAQNSNNFIPQNIEEKDVSFSLCQSPKELKNFENFPESIQKDDPYFIPQYPGTVQREIDPKSIFCQQDGIIHPVIAYYKNIPVGRIAVIVNNAYNHYASDQVGFFGFFDSIDNITIAKSLINYASNFLKKHGKNVIRGPYNPTIHDTCGLLVEGFNTAISGVGMPYNPSYYPSLIEATGLLPVRNLFALEVPLQNFVKPPERFEKVLQRLNKNQKISFRDIDMNNIDNEIEIIHSLYNKTLDRNWGFYPLKKEYFKSAFQHFKAIVDPKINYYLCMDGKEVGIVLLLPNFNQILCATKRRHGLLRLLEIGFRLYFQKMDAVRLFFLGLHPDYRDRGLNVFLFCETLRRVIASKQYLYGEVSWVEENNLQIIKAAKLMNGHIVRKYSIFEKLIS